jgi:hypothetical protein
MNSINSTMKKITAFLFFCMQFFIAYQANAGYKYGQSSFYQVTGPVSLGTLNQQIFMGTSGWSNYNFCWWLGISSLSFNMVNTDNAAITKAKIWYNTVNDFSTATLKDSISNPTGTITFSITDVDSLELTSIFFYLTYDIAASGCNGNTLDASIPTGGITVIGNVAGLKTPVSGSNPSGNRSISTTAFTPSVSLTTSSSNVVSGSSVTVTPTAVNGGSNPSFAYYVNGILAATTNGAYTINSITSTTTVYCIMTSNLPCVSPLTATSATKTINILGYKYSASSFYQVTGSVALELRTNKLCMLSLMALLLPLLVVGV